MVSVIIPVFETEDYIKECLDSVVGQTYKDIEILLVVAKSTDNSAQICEEYANKDPRIRIIEQEADGAGEARNQGVSVAKGEYICFVDSDDWVEPCFVEKLYGAMTSNNVEHVECDYYMGPTGNERIRGNSPYIGDTYDLIRVLGAPACWKQMFKKEMWDREGLQFTNTVAEDLFLYSDVRRVCHGSYFLREALYHYRIRGGSFSDTAKKDSEKYTELLSLFKLLVDRYKERGIFESCRDELYKQLVPHANIRYRAINGKVDLETLKGLRSESDKFFRNAFGKDKNSFNQKVVAFGSYNLGRIGNYLSAEPIEDMRYSFSSIVSAMSTDKSGLSGLKNDNKYRLRMLEKDVRGGFGSELVNNPPDVLLIDFLEERYGLVESVGCFYTDSDAFKESWPGDGDCRTITALGDEYEDLWKKACDKLINVLLPQMDKCKVIVVEDYLSEYLGNIYSKRPAVTEEIKAVNSKLRVYYEYFENHCPGAIIVRADDIPDGLVYTDEAFEHGAYPEHMNVYYYGYIANRIALI